MEDFKYWAYLPLAVIVVFCLGYICGKAIEKRRCQKKTKEVQQFMEDIFFKTAWDDLVELLEVIADSNGELRQRIGMLVKESEYIYQEHSSFQVYCFLDSVFVELAEDRWKSVLGGNGQELLVNIMQQFKSFYQIQEKEISIGEYRVEMHAWYREFTLQQVAVKECIKERRIKIEE